MENNLHTDWKIILAEEFKQPYFKKLMEVLKAEYDSGKEIYPSKKKVFNAFNLTSFSEVKVVLLGQDPYHQEGQAQGLSFSVPKEMKIPPSLRNIYKELQADLNIELPENGDLTHWAKQGVFLLNSILTVEKGKANAHQKIGWSKFTDRVIQKIASEKEGIIFILWGNSAIQKEYLIEGKGHTILKSAHPSPLSAYNGFWNSKPFSKTNHILIQNGNLPINW